MTEEFIADFTDEHREKLAKEGFLEITDDIPERAVRTEVGKFRIVPLQPTPAWAEAPYEIRWFKRGYGPKAEYLNVVCKRGGDL